jgi:hypothetical protein
LSEKVAGRREAAERRKPLFRVDHPLLGPSLRELHIYPLGDLHIGHRGFRRQAFRARREEILADPFSLVVLTGDIIENVTRSSVGDIYEDLEIPSPQDQIDDAVSELAPLADRIVGSVRGNHEWRTPKDVGVDPARYLADRLGVPYFRDEAPLWISFGQGYNNRPMTYLVYLNHLAGGGQTDGAKVNAGSRAARYIVADVCIGGHTHMPETHPVAIEVPNWNNGNLIRRMTLIVNAGTYQDRGGFPARKVMAPAIIGSPVVRLSGVRRRGSAEVTV